LTHLTPHDGDVRYGSVTWGPDGDALYLTTDANADTLELVRLDLATGELKLVESGDEWNVGGVVIDHDHRRIAYSRNVDGYSDLTVGDLVDETTIDRLPSPDLPPGAYGVGRFGPGGNRLPVTVTGPTRPTNVWLVDVRTGAAERWTDAATAGIPVESFVAPETVHIESFDGREIPALFSVPEGKGPFPVVVDIHGGPESQRRPTFSPVTQYLINAGYAVFEPNVRGSTGYGKAYSRLDDVRKRMDSVRDIHAGLDWLASRPDVDPDRFVAIGASYGGFMVLACLTEEPDRWAAGVDIVGIANFITFLQNTGEWRRSLREAEYGSLSEDREFLAEISPINRIDRIAAPLLVLHGANDPRVPVDEAEQIASEAAKHVPTEKVIFEDEGHGFSKLENRIEAYRRIVDFLEEHL
ncbi:MAG: S9 family peptidase, partial [Halobacteriales archaeon]|nr:S9 family peptidase [Halobacteriales archaeon]